MIKLTFVQHDGTIHEVTGKSGETLMETAISNDVPGIDADCGGSCACGTCHVYVNLDWSSKVGERNETEELMLSFSENVESNSRLSCQIEVSKEIEGLTVKIPEAQY
jgi:2Fe-2S ferredoxin|tara:strand:- start:1670 stop:1990 length:321 start_codon:yes stop_codon:yes gene_type:complete